MKEGTRIGNRYTYICRIISVVCVYLCVVGGQAWLSPGMPGFISPTAYLKRGRPYAGRMYILQRPRKRRGEFPRGEGTEVWSERGGGGWFTTAYLFQGLTVIESFKLAEVNLP